MPRQVPPGPRRGTATQSTVTRDRWGLQRWSSGGSALNLNREPARLGPRPAGPLTGQPPRWQHQRRPLEAPEPYDGDQYWLKKMTSVDWRAEFDADTEKGLET